MTNQKKLLALLSVLLLAALACSAPISGGDSSDNGDTGDTGSGGSVQPVDPTPTENSGILFQDDFSSSASGWEDLYRDESGMTDYDQSGFRIQVLQPNFDYWANPNLSFTDVVVEADATKIGGPDDNDFGVICRYQQYGDPVVFNFYFFIVTSDGFYGIGKYTGNTPETNEQVFIGDDLLQPTDVIRPGNATNQVKAECIGSTLRLYANGTLLQEVTDTEFSSGDVGLIAGTFDEPGTDILFDNFVVRAP